jgi:hypothetical protein
MIVTRQIVAGKIRDYLMHRLSLNDLTEWAERAMMEAEFEEPHVELLSEIIAKLGLADVRAFGLTWEDCKEFLNILGYRTQVSITPFDQAAPALSES